MHTSNSVVVESTIHAIRDCGFVSMVWINVLPTRPETFFSACQEKGWYYGISRMKAICCLIHSSESSSELISSAKVWTKSFVAKEFINQWACTSMTVGRWQLLGLGWVKVDVDGSVARQISKVAIGEAMRGSSGGCLVGLKMTVGLLGILQVEVKAILEGIELAWNRGFREVELESDNTMLIEFIRNGWASMSNVDEIKCIHD
ncbi:hypothetical protein Gohar_009864 [Gossypium harknessii]|uniref:RNase H type-1 domain-containing protein n=1 Tax=Gossypium harknessii TaxID=34285 RepID=A0A7J9GP50_9ROSI|nr:hypothetical protein [Gossypium harknessii]